MGISLKYQNKINEIYQLTFSAVHGENKKDITTTDYKKILEAEFNSFDSCIKRFLKDNKEKILSIYDMIKNGTHPYNEVEIIPIESISDKYSEYFSGMVEYVKKSCGLDFNKPNGDFNEYFNKLVNQDKSNTDSIFDGDFEDEINFVPIGIAMKNIEYFMNIDSDFNNFVMILDKLITSCHANCDMECAKKALELYVISVSYYLYKTITYIMSNFDNITENIANRTPSPYKKRVTGLKIV